MSHDPIRRRLLGLAIASTALAVIAGQLIDWPLSRWVASEPRSPLWPQSVGVLEWIFGVAIWNDFFVPSALALGAIVTVSVPRWRRVARVWAYLAISNLLARDLMVYAKIFAGRLRPHQWVHTGGATFGHLGTGNSFPSGHITVFSALILPLVAVWPRLWPLLIVIPFLMIERIMVLAHFLSDTAGALAIVSFVAWALYPLLGPRLARVRRGE